MKDTGPAQSPAPGGEEDRVELLIRLLKLANFISTPMRDGVCEPSGVSVNELKAIMALAGEGELAGHDLVEIMRIPPMNVSRALADLKRRGWVAVGTDPANRRRKPVALTEAGKAAYDAMKPDIARIADALLGKLSPRRQRELASTADIVLERIANWTAEHRRDMGTPSNPM